MFGREGTDGKSFVGGYSSSSSSLHHQNPVFPSSGAQGSVSLLTLPNIRILTPKEPSVKNDSTASSSAPSSTSTPNTTIKNLKKRLVFASEEEMLAHKEIEQRQTKLDEERSKLTQISPSTVSLEQGLSAYNRYFIQLITSTSDANADITITSTTATEVVVKNQGDHEPYSNGGFQNDVMMDSFDFFLPSGKNCDSWRTFRWDDVSLDFLAFEKCCVAFNKACYELSIFKTWYKKKFKQWGEFDLLVIEERIKSNYVKRQHAEKTHGEVRAVGGGVGGIENDGFHIRSTPPSFSDGDFREEIKQMTAKLKNLSFDFYLLSKKAFPANGVWAPEFKGICDSSVCEDMGRLCLFYVVTLNHIMLDKSYHPTKETIRIPKSFTYDQFKSAILLCHYKEMVVNVLDPNVDDLISVIDPSSSSSSYLATSCYSPIKHRAYLILIMCLVRYICDDVSIESKVKKTGQLLSIYFALKKHLRFFCAHGGDGSQRRQQQQRQTQQTNLVLSKYTLNESLISELSNHVERCLSTLIRYNDTVTHDRVNDGLTLKSLLCEYVYPFTEMLSSSHGVFIPQSWTPVFGAAPSHRQFVRTHVSANAHQLSCTSSSSFSSSSLVSSVKKNDDQGGESKSNKRDLAIYLCLKTLIKYRGELDMMTVSSYSNEIELTQDDIWSIVSVEIERLEKKGCA